MILKLPAHTSNIMEAMLYFDAPDIWKAVYEGRKCSCGYVWIHLSCTARTSAFR